MHQKSKHAQQHHSGGGHAYDKWLHSLCHQWSLRGQKPERKTRSVSAKHQVSMKLVGKVCVLYLETAYAISLMVSLIPADLYHFCLLFCRTAHFMIMSASRRLVLFRSGRSFHINFFLKTKTIFKCPQTENNRQHPSRHSATHQSNSGRLTSGRGTPPGPSVCGRWSDLICSDQTRSGRERVQLVAHERPRSEIVNKVTHTLTCTHARRYPFPWQLKMADVRLMFWLLPVVLIAAPNNRRWSFFFHFQEAVRHTAGHPKIALNPLCLKDATVCLFSHLNLVLSGFAHHKSDFSWSTFGCVYWSVVGEVAPRVPPGPGWK